MPTPTGYDYLVINTLATNGVPYRKNNSSQPQKAEPLAAFSGSAALYHAVSSSQGTYTWNSDTGEITLNNSGNYYIHGTVVAASDLFTVFGGNSAGYMAISCSQPSVVAFPNEESSAKKQDIYASGTWGEVACHGIISDFGPVGSDPRGEFSPRSNPYQMFISGAQAGTVIKPVFRAVGADGKPFKNVTVSDSQAISLLAGTSIVVQNFPDNDIDQAYVFSAYQDAVGLRTNLSPFDQIAHWSLASGSAPIGGPYPSTFREFYSSASFGYELAAADLGPGDKADTGSIGPTTALANRWSGHGGSNDNQRYMVQLLEGYGGDGFGAIPSAFSGWQFLSAPTGRGNPLGRGYMGGRISYGTFSTTASALPVRAKTRLPLALFPANFSMNAYSSILSWNDQGWNSTPTVKPRSLGITTVNSHSLNPGDLGSGLSDIFTVGSIMTGSTLAIIPMAPYSDDTKNDAYFSLNAAVQEPVTALDIVAEMSMSSKFIGTPSTGMPAMNAASGHRNVWMGSRPRLSGGGLGLFNFGLFSQVKFNMDNNSAGTTNTVAAPFNLLTASGITPDFDEGKLTVNHDGMYVFKQHFSNISISASVFTERTAIPFTFRIRKNATSGSGVGADLNYTSSGEILYSKIVKLDQANAGGAVGSHIITAFSLSAGDYITCDISGAVPAASGDIVLTNGGGNFNMSFYRIGEIPGFTPPAVGGVDLFNRDLSVINRYSVSNQYTTASIQQVPFILGSRGITTIRDRDEPPAPQIGRREIIRKKRR